MSDLIERQKAIDVMRRRRALFCKNRIEYMALPKDEKARVDEIDNCISDLLNAPDAELERKKGEWRHLGGDEWCCTNCGYVVSTEGAWEHPKEQGKDYCEHCGADMREEKHGQQD